MKKTDKDYANYVAILKEELIPAMGCTEPIAVAYCAALARANLQNIPQKVEVEVSGNIIKNVKSVIVPNTNGMKGIEAAVAAGIIAGDEKKALEVISNVSEEQKNQLREYLKYTPIQIKPIEQGELLDIIVTVFADKDYTKVRIAHSHTNVVWIEKNGVCVLDQKSNNSGEETSLANTNTLTVEKIYDFAESVDISDIKDIISCQIQYNTAVSEEGLKGSWGASIGKIIIDSYGDNVRQRAKAAAAAGSDARMSGCELPVVVNSGSGNQGITISMPIITYAKELRCSEEKLYRALVLANLISIHQKKGIGCLSAYCGAVSAGAAAGCGIAYLHGGDLKTIAHTWVNAIAITSGMVCDGAKPSCAAKIAMAVDAGILGFEMYQNGQQFRDGEGIVSKGIENTIDNVSRLGSEGMRQTDREIIRIMTRS